MKYLLDTHTFLWFITDDKQLSAKATKAIVNPDAAKYVSMASFWEIAIKLNIGKLELDMPFDDLLQQMDINGFTLLPIEFAHTSAVCALDRHHGDPFDRMIIAQAQVEDLIVISIDKNFSKYRPLQILW